MNGKILKETPFERLYVTPDPGDGGGALGAALYMAKRLGEKETNGDFYPALGPGYSHDQIERTLKDYGLKYKLSTGKELLDRVSDLLIKRKVIGWFQGRMEWGPRALGFRSILASAAESRMKDIINAKVKKREMFRPFAPVILADQVNKYFEADRKVPVSAKYMLSVYPFRERMKKRVPAVVHVDGTGRLQTVERREKIILYIMI
jgi:carbamoyltransferase